MARTQISIKLDSDLLARVDQLAEDAGFNRTAVIEQAIKNDLSEQDAFQRQMEIHVFRAIHKQITRPIVLRAIAKLSNGELSDDEIAKFIERAARQRETAKRRVDSRKGSQRKPRLEGA